MLDDSLKVEMPTEKIIFREIKNTTYAYHVLRSYRNSKGQPTCDTALIGKKDIESGKLIPNKRYFQIYKNSIKDTSEDNKEELSLNSVLDYGNNYILDFILDKYDILSTLQRAFPEIYMEIATLAKYMVCEGNVYYYCEDWCEKTFTGFDNIITSQKSSVVCKSIDLDSRIEFFKRWIYAREQEEYLAYDVTSVSSYSRGNDNIEWGYNRDKEQLPQINLGMIFGENSKIPVYYNVYPGSIPDKSYLDYMFRDIEMLGIKYSKLVMDKGFFTEENLKKLENKTLGFIISMPINQVIPQRIIDENKGLQFKSKYSLGAGKPYAKCITIDDYGFRSNVHVYFDTMKFHEELERLYENLEKREEILLGMSEKPSTKNPYDKYFDFSGADNSSFSFVRNEDKIDQAISKMGYFLIMTTDFELSSEEVLDIYKRKDVVEKCFDNLKNELDMKRIRSHKKETADGKMFIAFVALILRSILENVLGEFNKKNNYTIEKVLKEVSKIRLVKFDNGTSLLNPITKKQRDILELFTIKADDINKSIKNIRT